MPHIVLRQIVVSVLKITSLAIVYLATVDLEINVKEIVTVTRIHVMVKEHVMRDQALVIHVIVKMGSLVISVKWTLMSAM